MKIAWRGKRWFPITGDPPFALRFLSWKWWSTSAHQSGFKWRGCLFLIPFCGFKMVSTGEAKSNDTFEQGSLHDTPEHCLVNGGFPLFWWKKQHVSNAKAKWRGAHLEGTQPGLLSQTQLGLLHASPGSCAPWASMRRAPGENRAWVTF